MKRIGALPMGIKMQEIIFLRPIFKEMIWGGNRLSKEFNYEIPSDMTGECWAVSAHKSGDCEIVNGTYAGKHLSTLWDEHRELFGGIDGEVFPILVKIIDAKDDLSIQVHPNDFYAKENENGYLGKTECWYILDCDDDAKIVIGHYAKDKDELKQMIADGMWDKLIRVIPVKKGDFFQIEPGTVHAIKAGTLILETQQSSDITYRLYDYGRLQNKKPRELHLQKSIDVIVCPHVDTVIRNKVTTYSGGVMEELVSGEFYTVNKITVDGEIIRKQTEPFTIVSVVEGEGVIDNTSIRKGDHFILPSGYGEYKLSGRMLILSSYTTLG